MSDDWFDEEITTMSSEEYLRRFCKGDWEFERTKEGWYASKQPYSNGPFKTAKEAEMAIFGEEK